MKIAALVFLALYLLIGVRSIFWYRTVPGILQDLTPRAPRWKVVIVLLVSLPFDVLLWPINAIDRHRNAR